MSNIHQMKRYAIVGTPTPSDGWSSYFDSWRAEDTQVPTFEPLIVDDELHPDLSNMRFNMDMEVDWDMDMQSPYVSAVQTKGKTKLNVAHPDYQRHGLQRNDVVGFDRPWLGSINDDGGRPLRQIQIGAGGDPSGVYGPPRTAEGMSKGMDTDVHPRAPQLCIRRAFKVKVSSIIPLCVLGVWDEVLRTPYRAPHYHAHYLHHCPPHHVHHHSPIHAIIAPFFIVSLVIVTVMVALFHLLQPPLPTAPR